MLNPDSTESLRAVSYTHLDVYKRQVLMRTMCKEGVLMTVIVNKRPESAAIRLRTGRYGVPRVIYGEASVKGAQVTVGADRCAVVLWSR